MLEELISKQNIDCRAALAMTEISQAGKKREDHGV